MGEGKPGGQSQGLPYSPFPLLSTAHHSSLGFRDAAALRLSATLKRFGAVKTLQGLLKASARFASPQRACNGYQALRCAQRYLGMSKRVRDYKALRFSLRYKAPQRCQSASFPRPRAPEDPHLAAGPAAPGRAGARGPERRGRAAGLDRRVARPAPAAPPTSPGRKGPAPPGSAASGTPRPPLPSVRRTSTPPPPRPGRSAPATSSPPAPVLPPRPGLRPISDHTSLRCTRLPERALRPAARRAGGAGPATDEGRPLLQ